MLVQADKIEIQLDTLSLEMPKQKTFITQQGMFVKVVRPLLESTPIVVRLTIGGKTAEVLADVRNCYEEIGMVIKFIDWPPRALCQLEDFIGRNQHGQKIEPTQGT